MQIDTKRLTMNAMLAAMCAVLGYLAIDTGNIKITFESLPVFVAALMMGPWDGLCVGTLGTLIYQLLRYGVTATTALWMLPYAAGGFFMGIIARRQHFELSKKALMLTVIGTELMITVLNTGVIYIDSKLYGWYYPALIVGTLAVRLGISLIKGGLFGAVLPILILKIHRFVTPKKES